MGIKLKRLKAEYETAWEAAYNAWAKDGAAADVVYQDTYEATRVAYYDELRNSNRVRLNLS